MSDSAFKHKLMHHFEPHMRELGASLIGLGQVQVYQMDPAGAKVMSTEGDKKIHSQLAWLQIRDHRSLMVSCDCTHFKFKGLCKHLWASILSVDNRAFSHGAPLAEKIDLVLGQTQSEDSLVLTEKAKLEVENSTRINPPYHHASLHLLSRSLARSRAIESTQSNIEVKENQLWFELVLKEASDGNVHVVMHTRERLKNGHEWGMPKVFNATKEKLAELSDPADIKIAQLLRKMTYWDNPNATMRANARGKQSIAEVPPALFDLIFTTLTDRSRLFILSSDGKPISLTWRPKKYFRARVKVEKNQNEWSLKGEFLSTHSTLSHTQVHPLWWCDLLVAGGQICRLKSYGLGPFFQHLKEKKTHEIKFSDSDETRSDLRKFLIESVGAQNIAGDIEDTNNSDDTVESSGLGISLRELSPTPILKLDISHSEFQTLLTAKVRMEYQGVEMIPLSAETLPIRQKDGHSFMRNLESEADFMEELESDETVTVIPKDVDPTLTIKFEGLVELVRKLSEKGWIIKGHQGVRASRRLLAPVRRESRLKTFEQWIEFQSELEFEGEIFDLPSLLSKLKEGKYITLADGSLGLVPQEWLRKQLALAQLGSEEAGLYQIERKNLPFIDIILEEMPETRIDVSLAGLRDNLRNWRDSSVVDLPKSFRTQLRPYQQTGLKWMQFIAELGLGGCLADDMGLGKTVQVLALLESRRLLLIKENKKLPTLVVLPKSLMPNWRMEAQKFAPSMSVHLYEGKPSDRVEMREQLSGRNIPDVVLTTYGLVRQDIKELSEIPFDYVILDEAQAIKNDQSMSAKAVRELNARIRLAITGTPVENGLDELFSLFHFLLPSVFGSRVIKQTLLKGNEDVTKNILSALRPFILRRTKAQVLTDLPQKSESILYCEMEENQKRFYASLHATYKASLGNDVEVSDQEGPRQSVHVLEAMLRLRQAACDPHLVDPHLDDSTSAKHEVLLHKLHDIKASGSKALIFSQFTSHLKIIERKLHAHHYKTSYLDGSTNNREEAIRRFKEDPECTVFLISLKAGGFGLNLTEASYVFLMDPWWNPAVEAQAIDRIHRIGQKQAVFAYRIVTRDTIEEKVLLLQQEKRLVAQGLESTDGQALQKMSMKDLNFLFS